AIDRNGKLLFEYNEFGSIGPFSEGLAVANSGEVNEAGEPLFGYIDRQGKYEIRPRFLQAMRFSEGLAPVLDGDVLGYVDRKGTMVINKDFSEVHPFVEGLARAKFKEKWGFIDSNGEWAIKPTLYAADDFSEGLARVLVQDKKAMSDFQKQCEKEDSEEDNKFMEGIGKVFGSVTGRRPGQRAHYG
ncbi:hypothetical protein BVY04_01110, partial [bacterium M21]